MKIQAWLSDTNAKVMRFFQSAKENNKGIV